MFFDIGARIEWFPIGYRGDGISSLVITVDCLGIGPLNTV